MTAPLVTLSCPSCGGSVKRPKAGKTVACRSCGTDLTPDCEAPPRYRPHLLPVLFLVILVLAAFAGFFMTRSKSPATPSVPPEPPPVPRSPEVEKGMKEADCLLECVESCDDKDPTIYATCAEGCTTRCEKR